MKKLNALALILALIACACQPTKDGSTESSAAADTTEIAPVSLKLKWETDTLLTTCESVIYDKERDVLYVANINGEPSTKDGNGFISKVSLDGKITEAQWVKGIDSPKGMGLVGTKLYVTDIDRVHEIDVTSGKITKTYRIEGAKFLNDITTDASGKVYMSDSNSGVISVIENGKVSKWLENLTGPNGLLAEDGGMLVALWAPKNLNSVDLSTKQVTLRTDSLENPDGIEAVGNGGYLVSSWNGLVHYISPDWEKTLILDTRADSVSAADIEYIQEKNLLLVPTFFKNKVMAYELSKN
jgi:sugar lactone lactonase YvrE